MTAYTRNPAILRIFNQVGDVEDILEHTVAHHRQEDIPHASLHEGILYHIDRYAPHGLYGSFDPAERPYQDTPLNVRCDLLKNPNNALALAVYLPKGGDHE